MLSSINFPASNNDLCKFHDSTRSLKCSEEHTTFSLVIYFLIPRGTEFIRRLTLGFFVNGNGGNGASCDSDKFAHVFSFLYSLQNSSKFIVTICSATRGFIKP